VKTPTTLGVVSVSDVQQQATLVKVTQTSAAASTACVLTQASTTDDPLLHSGAPTDPSRSPVACRHVSL